MRTTRSRRLRLLVWGAATAVGAVGMSSPSQADNTVPRSCSLHPTHVVTPGCVPSLTSNATAPVAGYPNVRSDVRQVQVWRPFEFQPDGTFKQVGPFLSFDSWVQNLGPHPLELFADDPNNPTTAQQCVAWTATYVCREHRVVGEYAWHEEHSHYHFQDFADYQLRHLNADGTPDYSSAGLMSRSEKVSFCLVDSTLVDITKPSPSLYTTCGPTRQGVSPGWADIYDVGTPGQQLPLTGVPDGRYALIVTMDYPNRILETDDTDNVLEVIVEISEGTNSASIVSKRIAPAE